MDERTVHAGVVTRQTDTHIFFVFAQEPDNAAESFVQRNRANLRRGDTILVESLEPGVWFVTDAMSVVGLSGLR